MSRRGLLVAAQLGYVGAIVLANYLTTEYGLQPVTTALFVTAGTFVAGLPFVLRDVIDELSGMVNVLAMIVVGGALSFVVSDPYVALASAAAFLFSELADFAVYRPLRRQGRARAAVVSNVVGSVVDSWLFLWIAPFAIAFDVMSGQVIVKAVITSAAVGVLAACATSRTR